MLEAGELPLPETEEHARAFRKVGGKRPGGYKSPLLATLPEGWRAVQTESRFGVLFDSQGRRRASFFYKHTSYEWRSWFKMETRYSTRSERPDDKTACAWDRETSSVLYTPTARSARAAHNEVVAWLDKHYKHWRDPSRYWSDIRRPWWRFW